MLYGLFIPYLEDRVRFPAIKTHSVPNLLARSTASGDQPMKAEKSNSAGARINRDNRNKRWQELLRDWNGDVYKKLNGQFVRLC